MQVADPGTGRGDGSDDSPTDEDGSDYIDANHDRTTTTVAPAATAGATTTVSPTTAATTTA